MAVWTNQVGRKQQNAVPLLLELACPMVRRAAGLKKDGGRLALCEEPEKRCPSQSMPISHDAWPFGHCDFEDILCKINRDERMLHVDSSFRVHTECETTLAP